MTSSARAAFTSASGHHSPAPRYLNSVGLHGCVEVDGHDWLGGPMIVVAVNAHAGEVTAFDRRSGVDLVGAETRAPHFPSPPHA